MAHDNQYSHRSALFTDLYQLTMGQAYVAESMEAPAVFEMFFRSLPDNRNYMVAAGLEDALEYLQHLHFTPSDLEYLRKQETFSEEFLSRLESFRFRGDVYAVKEGTVVFPNEPLLQVVAPILDAQLVETYLLNQLHFQTVAATKAARVVLAADGRNVVDFGSRRSHGVDAAMKVARCSYLAGAAGTSNVLAGKVYGVPIFGTMAHSYVQAHDDELDAFEAFAEQFPETTLLVDTYDTLEGVKKVIEMKEKWGERFRVRALRLDSGDLIELAKQSRQMLDDAGLKDVKLFASSSLDEFKLEEMIAEGAPIDGFGVGTRLAVIEDAPDVDIAYKLVEYAGKPRMKLSASKLIHPRRKQVYRLSSNDKMERDVIAIHDEKHDGVPLLEQVMRGGQRLSGKRPALADIREHANQQLKTLPKHLKNLYTSQTPYPIEISSRLQEATQQLMAELEESQ